MLEQEPTVIGNSEVMNTTKGTGKSRRINDVDSSDTELSEGELKAVEEQLARQKAKAQAAAHAKGGEEDKSSAGKEKVSVRSKDKVNNTFTLIRSVLIHAAMLQGKKKAVEDKSATPPATSKVSHDSLLPLQR